MSEAAGSHVGRWGVGPGEVGPGMVRRALGALGYDLSYDDQRVHALRFIAELRKEVGPLTEATIVEVARRGVPDLAAAQVAPDKPERPVYRDPHVFFALAVLGHLGPNAPIWGSRRHALLPDEPAPL